MLKNKEIDTYPIYEHTTVEQLEQILEEEKVEDIFDIGYVTGGLYKIGKGLYTSREGYEKFLESVRKEFLKCLEEEKLNNLK